MINKKGTTNQLLIAIGVVIILIILIITITIINQNKNTLSSDEKSEEEEKIQSSCSGTSSIGCAGITRTSNGFTLSMKNSIKSDIIPLEITVRGDVKEGNECKYKPEQNIWKSEETKEFFIECELKNKEQNNIETIVKYYLPEQGISINHEVKLQSVLVE